MTRQLKLLLVRALPPGAINVLRLMARPKSAAAVALDLARTWREVRFLRQSIGPAPAGAPRVLVMLMTDSIYEIKLQLFLAAGLRMNGWEPVVLAATGGWTLTAAYSRAYGVRRVIGFDQFALTPEDQRRCVVAAERLLTGDVTFTDAKQWVWEECWIGPQVLGALSRAHFQGAPDLSHPDIRAALKRTLPESLADAVRARRLVDHIGPSLGIAMEANYPRNGAVVDRTIAAGATVIQVTQPWRDDALMCRRLTRETRRQHPSSLSAESLARVSQRPWTSKQEQELQGEFADRYGGTWFLQGRNQRGTRTFGADELRTRLRLPEGRKLVVIFSHVLWDANLFYGDDLFDDYGDWFVQTLAAAVRNPEVDWLVKLHPANVWKRAYQHFEGEYTELALIREHLGALPDHVRLLPADTEISTLSLYEAADCGVTVRGTPGMEMPCFGKQVLTAGTGRYSGLGFTLDSATREEYFSRLARVQDLGPLGEDVVLLAKRHAHTVFRKRQWEMRSLKSYFNYRPQGSDPLDHNLRIAVRSVEEIQVNGDLARWSAWAGDFEQVDYLHE